VIEPNFDEKLAKTYLSQLGYSSIVYEPDGNIPPDFLVDGKIAVEVRRLNQNSTSQNGVIKGLEEQTIPLWHKLENLLSSYGVPQNGKSWFVGVRFRRPIESWNKLMPKIQKLLEDIKNQELDKMVTYEISENFTIKFNPVPEPLDNMFLMAVSTDMDAGGFILSKMEINLKLIVAEKSKKIEKFKSKYDEWWLILTNYIGYSLSDFEKKQFKETLLMSHDWDKIVLINPLEPSNLFEI